MPTLLIAAVKPLAGKTTVAIALARALAKAGKGASLERSGEDANAAADTQTFASLGQAAGDTKVIELPVGDPSAALAERAGSRVLVVATPETAAEASAMAKAAGASLAGVVLNRARKAGGEGSAGYEGVTPLAVIPEDAALAAPSLGVVREALEAEALHVEDDPSRTLGRVVIASIAADPGQAYFDRTRADSVIVRSDKPDLQLAALNAGAECLIITGGLPVLNYVQERVAEDEVPFMRTQLDTKATVEAIESLFGATPFAADAQRLRRLDELFAGMDVSAL